MLALSSMIIVNRSVKSVTCTSIDLEYFMCNIICTTVYLTWGAFLKEKLLQNLIKKMMSLPGIRPATYYSIYMYYLDAMLNTNHNDCTSR